MNAPNIHSFSRVIPMIYAYNTPGVAYHDGWTKIGYTEKQSVEDRVRQQTHTADVRPVIAWQDNAMFKDGSGEYFTDHDFHAYLETQAKVERQPKTEWFRVDGDGSLLLFNRFARRQGAAAEDERLTYTLREEQDEAVRKTQGYFEGGGAEFLWNAKPRFGKTLTCYDLVRRMKMKDVLIVTNRPSIADSWATDFRRFIAWQEKLVFVAETDALRGRPGVMTHDEYVKMTIGREDGFDYGTVNFLSLQDMKGSVYLGGKFDKLDWVYHKQFDLLIVDESQEGVDTEKTDRAFKNIKRAHTLYLSGTPFRQLASGRFGEEQIFNWSYADEQQKKEAWDGEDYNPYEALPRMEMYTYQLSPMIREKLEKGLELPDEDGAVDYAFDLNEFFATKENGRFEHEEEIRKFLHALTTQEKYPFSTPELRDELKHTLWYLNRVASAKALEKLLREDPVFGEYEVILAAGDGKTDDEALEDQRQKKALERVREAINANEKTITLTVGQLTVGVTVPEWSGVLMLCNLKSPSSYMQAAFRAQNPCVVTVGGQRMRKQTAYVFDFDPARTLIIFDEFANNLSPRTAGDRGAADDRTENIRRLLNFFPVIGEDSEGRMVELNEKQVLSIPRRIKSQEVVRRGFMSNFLFQNISNIFGAPAAVREIVGKLNPAQEEKSRKSDPHTLDAMDDVQVDGQGEVVIDGERIIGTAVGLFGPKVFEGVPAPVGDLILDAFHESGDVHIDRFHELTEAVWTDLSQRAVTAQEAYGQVGSRVKKQIDENNRRGIEQINRLKEDFEQEKRIAETERARKLREAETESQIQKAQREYDDALSGAMDSFTSALQTQVKQTIDEKTAETVEILEREKKNREKRSVEDEVRAHLRGFARTIPSFIMAYDDGGLTLANFDTYTEDEVFLEVTGITEENFRFLRDGGEYFDEEKGEMKLYPGHLFDETVFIDSIAEFRRIKERLADYFDETLDEDIFDYIPPQKTNQIFTPKRVVKQMVDLLEENNPGCFDDPTKTFADLYMKSGLYITEIVKRLFRSEGLKRAYPDEKERIRHILREQVYGMAPTRIIYLIATNYILGFDPQLKAETEHFVEADAALAAKNGELQALVDRYFGI
ncbi:MAG: DEAD/DEAH box helicase family protein [Clostridia bacterium]|nr:DEAD/DEAH box helicase family protein [Clostridia bacterium]